MENKEKQYIRARIELINTKCLRCGKTITKNSDKQIVYYCSSECRKDKDRPKFRFVKEEL